MSAFFEEIAYQPTPIGPISPRRRRDFRLKTDIVEIMLGDEHLMSDPFTTSEIALATLGLAYHREQDDKGRQLDVVVSGVGLGYNTDSVLCNNSVGSLWVVKALQAIIDWHKSDLLLLGKILCANPRCKFVCSDFFASTGGYCGFDTTQRGRCFNAILVDINLASDFHLAPKNTGF